MRPSRKSSDEFRPGGEGPTAQVPVAVRVSIPMLISRKGHFSSRGWKEGNVPPTDPSADPFAGIAFEELEASLRRGGDLNASTS